jgi:hypothetical protein
VNLVQQDFPNLHHSPQQFWQQPHSQLFEDGPPLSSCHYVKVLQFLFYHLLPLFELAPSSAQQSSCTLSCTPPAACLHTSDKYQKEKEELIQQRSLYYCHPLFSLIDNTMDAGVDHHRSLLKSASQLLILAGIMSK